MDGDAISFSAAFERRHKRSISRAFEWLNPLRRDNPWKDGIDGFVAQGVIPARLLEATAPFELPATSKSDGPAFDLRSARQPAEAAPKTAEVIPLIPHRRCAAVEV